MTDTGLTFVLVHGSWCGGWVWREVADLLEAKGHKVFAPTLSGLADRSHLLNAQINLTTHILDVANLIRWEGLKDVVLVGHSYGGMVISGVADRIGAGAIRAIVYLDALYLADGERAAAGTEEPHRPVLIEVDGVRCLKPGSAAAAFGLDAAQAARVDALLTPMPAAAFAERPSIAGARDAVAAKTFVLAERCTMPFFRPIAEILSARPDWTIEHMDTDHLMMIEQPDQTANVLLRAAVGL
jgi:pimeloyl-ACP methyl ester carboxylesterase